MHHLYTHTTMDAFIGRVTAGNILPCTWYTKHISDILANIKEPESVLLDSSDNTLLKAWPMLWKNRLHPMDNEACCVFCPWRISYHLLTLCEKGYMRHWQWDWKNLRVVWRLLLDQRSWPVFLDDLHRTTCSKKYRHKFPNNWKDCWGHRIMPCLFYRTQGAPLAQSLHIRSNEILLKDSSLRMRAK